MHCLPIFKSRGLCSRIQSSHCRKNENVGSWMFIEIIPAQSSHGNHKSPDDFRWVHQYSLFYNAIYMYSYISFSVWSYRSFVTSNCQLARRDRVLFRPTITFRTTEMYCSALTQITWSVTLECLKTDDSNQSKSFRRVYVRIIEDITTENELCIVQMVNSRKALIVHARVTQCRRQKFDLLKGLACCIHILLGILVHLSRHLWKQHIS